MQRYIYIVETGIYICDFCNKPTNIAKIFMPLALKASIVAHFGAQHCSSLCLQSEGREPLADICGAAALNQIRPPHFASKVSYSASPQ